MSNQDWSKLHELYKGEEWVHRPSIFAETAIEQFPESGIVLELGAGHGQDSVYFAGKGFQVTATDLDARALEKTVSELPEELRKHIKPQAVDLREPLAFSDGQYDVVYAHLSLHYFDKKTTETLFAELARVLKPGGILAFLVNSVHDPEYKTGTQLEDDFFDIEGVPKRYFSTDSTHNFTKAFEPIVLDDEGETYKDRAKGVHNLIRYIGRKE